MYLTALIHSLLRNEKDLIEFIDFVSCSKIFDEEGLSLIGKKRTGNTTGVNIEVMVL